MVIIKKRLFASTGKKEIKEYNSWEIADIDFNTFGFRGRGGTTFEPVFEWIEKEVLNLGGNIHSLVPSEVIEILKNKFPEK